MITKEFIIKKKEKTKTPPNFFIKRNVKKIELKCDFCGRTHVRDFEHYNKMKKNELFIKDYCNECWRPLLNNRPDKIKKMTDGLKKVWNSEDKRKEMSETIKKVIEISGYMVGNRNPMKNSKTREKVGKTRSERMTIEERKKYSNGTKKAWEDGKFIGVNSTGKCIWFDYKHSNGEIYKVQGTWELKFIEWMDKMNIKFKCHKDRIKYIYDDGKEKNYYPDFYVYDWNSYVDIKSTYSYKGQERKFEILEKTSEIPIKLLFKPDLNKLGIKVK